MRLLFKGNICKCDRVKTQYACVPGATFTGIVLSFLFLSFDLQLFTWSTCQTLDDEWCRLRLVTLPPFEQTEMAPEEFRGNFSHQRWWWQYTVFRFMQFLHGLLSLPHANVDVERIFFFFFLSVNLIKTNTRNRLHTGTISSLLKVKDGVKAACRWLREFFFLI